MKKIIEDQWKELAKQRETFEKSLAGFELKLLRQDYDNLDNIVSRFKASMKMPNTDIHIANCLGITEKKLSDLVKKGKIVKSSKDQWGNDACTNEDVLKYFHTSLQDLCKKYPESAPTLWRRSIGIAC